MADTQASLREHVEYLSSVSESKHFLGREFLTWLWYVAETQGRPEALVHPDTGEQLTIDLWIDDRIVLEAHSGSVHENVMKGGDPSQSGEGAVALQQGMLVKELKLGVRVDDWGDFQCTLPADDLNPRSLKLPQTDDPDKGAAEAEELPLLGRIKATETFIAVLDGMFSRFLDQRLASGWESETLADMKKWIRAKAEESARTVH